MTEKQIIEANENKRNTRSHVNGQNIKTTLEVKQIISWYDSVEKGVDLYKEMSKQLRYMVDRQIIACQLQNAPKYKIRTVKFHTENKTYYAEVECMGISYVFLMYPISNQTYKFVSLTLA